MFVAACRHSPYFDDAKYAALALTRLVIARIGCPMRPRQTRSSRAGVGRVEGMSETKADKKVRRFEVMEIGRVESRLADRVVSTSQFTPHVLQLEVGECWLCTRMASQKRKSPKDQRWGG